MRLFVKQFFNAFYNGFFLTLPQTFSNPDFKKME